jgi:hypothetical protein
LDNLSFKPVETDSQHNAYKVYQQGSVNIFDLNKDNDPKTPQETNFLDQTPKIE